MDKRWTLNQSSETECISELSEELGVDHIIAKLLVQRGIKNYKEAKSFFRPSLNDLHDPFLMKDMDCAVDRLSKALKNNERILIYGDYDVDGTTSVSLVYSYLRDKFEYIDYYVPDRYKEGYGISKQAMDKIEYANSKNIDFIICDHHTPDDILPNAVAVLDPKRVDCEYPCKHLSGCGVGFKLMQGLCEIHNFEKAELLSLLDLVCVSIASDIVPIVGENRILAYHGLIRLNENPCLGLKTIIGLSGSTKDLTVNDIVFKVGPRINAAGRIQTGNASVQLLTSKKEETAKLVGETIDGFNEDRKELDHSITDEALERVANSEELKKKKSTVLFDANWHKGVIGIVASRMIEKYYKPTVILTESNGYATGSARSIDGFDLYNAISSCSDLLESYGGHKYAAGLTLKIENLKEFTRRFENYVCENIEDNMLIPQIKIDAEIKLKEITPKFFRILKQFEPFGPQNMTPIFVSREVVDYGYSRAVGRNKEHLKLSVVDDIRDNAVVGGIGFSLGNVYPSIANGAPFDICYSLQENEYMGKVETQLMVRDIKLP